MSWPCCNDTGSECLLSFTDFRPRRRLLHHVEHGELDRRDLDHRVVRIRRLLALRRAVAALVAGCQRNRQDRTIQQRTFESSLGRDCCAAALLRCGVLTFVEVRLGHEDERLDRDDHL